MKRGSSSRHFDVYLFNRHRIKELHSLLLNGFNLVNEDLHYTHPVKWQYQNSVTDNI